jgi:ABC-2 type transport system permease protein
VPAARAEPAPSALVRRSRGGGPARALVGRGLRDARTQTIAFGCLFAIYSGIQPLGYRTAYPTLADRVSFAHSFAGNDALRLFYGYPYDLLSAGGYTAWRVGGTLAIVAATFGVLAATRALRGEEDRGAAEMILAEPVARRATLVSAGLVTASSIFIVWLAEAAGLLAGGLAPGGGAYLALATASVAAVYAGVGALTSQIAPTRRIALELGSAVVAVSLLLRVVADTATGAAWLRWATPLGWAEELRPFSAQRPLVLLLPVASCVLLLALSARLAARRDLGTGMLRARDAAAPRLLLLSSPTAQTLRSEAVSLAVWTMSIGAFAFVLGMVSASVSSAGISRSIQQQLAKLGAGSIETPAGYLSLVFLFFVLAVSLFACAQIGAARHEEAAGRLETLLALGVSRRGWLAGRLRLASCAAATISMGAGLFAWLGAASQGVAVSLPRLLEAAANCLPVSLMFLGLAALAFAVAPRACQGIAYGLVTVTFLWQLSGTVLGAPGWLVKLTPFAHIGLVPAQPFRAADAIVMLGIGALSALAATWAFQRRDLVGE